MGVGVWRVQGAHLFQSVSRGSPSPHISQVPKGGKAKYVCFYGCECVVVHQNNNSHEQQQPRVMSLLLGQL